MSSRDIFGGGLGSAKQRINGSSLSSPEPQSSSTPNPPAKLVVPMFGGNNRTSNQPSLVVSDNHSLSPDDKPSFPVNTVPPGNSINDVLLASHIDPITSPPASSPSNESFFSETLEDPSSKKTTKSQHSSPKIPVDGNVFYNEETLKYMRIIDRYKKLGVGNDIELPRLVIAGAQSCGKSSLLENLTGLPVPITTGIGTRFPIEITLIEDDKKFQIKPSIVLDPKAPALSSMDMERMQKFNLGQVYNEPMTQVQFEEILREASNLFGVPSPLFARDQAANIRSVETPARQISSHVLQIEMRGPDFKSLSFVDTPGLYHSANSEQDATSVADIERLVVSLIGEDRTVIVAVMEATQSTVGQKIFKFADDVDVNGSRTLGVMTKCDLVVTSETDAFEATLRRANNQERTLNHGWYMVKNRSSTETKASVSLETAREKEQNLFTSSPWAPNVSGLDPSRVGIAALRTGLSNVFCAHIRAEFPAFNKQTRTILAQKKKELNRLGPDRSTLTKQREYLKSLVTVYDVLKRNCLSDDMRAGNPFNDPSFLLRKLDSAKKTGFRNTLKSTGAKWTFQTPSLTIDVIGDSNAAETNYEKTRSIYSWINHRYQSTKSSSLPGLVPPMLVERLFEEQTTKWKSITHEFLSSVEKLFLEAVEYCLHHACQNMLVVTTLKELITKAIQEKMASFEERCYNLIRNEQDGLQLIAGEEQFIREIRAARTARFISALARLEYEPSLNNVSAMSGTVKTETGTKPPTNSIFNFPEVKKASSPSSAPTPSLFGSATTAAKETSSGGLFSNVNAAGPPGSGFGALQPSTGIFGSSGPQHSFQSLLTFAHTNKSKLEEVITDDRQIIYEIHDILKAYYSTSVQHYTDAVCKNGLNKSFVGEIMGVFSREWVSKLEDEEVRSVAAESVADRKARRELGEHIERLERAIGESEVILNEPFGNYV